MLLLTGIIVGNNIAVAQAAEISNNQGDNSYTKGVEKPEEIINKYTIVYNNQYVLEISSKNNKFTQEEILEAKNILSEFNQKVRENNIILSSENTDISYSPFISFARTRKHKKAHHRSGKIHIVGYGSNGYCYKDSHGKYHYVVTRTPFQTVMHVMGHGWANAAASGFGLGLIK